MSGLIVFIVIALVLILLSLGIWKSSMPENDKVLTLILILAVFSLITIIHEAKRPNLSGIKGGYSNVSISATFFNFKQFEAQSDNCSATVFRELYSEEPHLKQMLNQKSRNESLFLLFRPKDDLALSEILHAFAAEQMKSRRPVIYIDFKREIFMKDNWTNYLGDFHENALLHELWKFREQNRVPWLILENFGLEPEFHDGHLAHLASLIYDDFAGDVVLKPADELTFALLKSGFEEIPNFRREHFSEGDSLKSKFEPQNLARENPETL